MQMVRVKIWDKEENGFQNIVDLNFEVKTVKLNDSLTDKTYKKKFEDVIFVRYTWQKDIENKEIYEGDILKNSNDEYFLVVGNEKGDEFYLRNDEKDIYLESSLIEKDEITNVGNMLQNRELLRKAFKEGV